MMILERGASPKLAMLMSILFTTMVRRGKVLLRTKVTLRCENSQFEDVNPRAPLAVDDKGVATD